MEKKQWGLKFIFRFLCFFFTPFTKLPDKKSNNVSGQKTVK